MEDNCHSDHTKLRKYLDFAEDNPSIFANPPEGGYQILLDEQEIRQAEATVGNKLRQKKLPMEWAQVGFAYQDQYITLIRDAVRFPDGYLGTYIRRIRTGLRPPGVVILPVYCNEILLLRHFRHATRNWHLEIPRGFGEEGFTNEENAMRELLEETGSTPTRMIEIGMMHDDTGMGSGNIALYYAEVSSIGEPETNEAISALLPTGKDEFERMIRDGNITDSFTIIAYTRAKLRDLI